MSYDTTISINHFNATGEKGQAGNTEILIGVETSPCTFVNFSISCLTPL